MTTRTMLGAGLMIAVTALTVVPLASTPAQTPDVREPQGLDDGRRWLEERATITPTSPPLLRAAAANALNDTQTAEGLLRGVIRSHAGSDAASQAYQLLSRIYLRSGQYQRLIENLDAWARAFPTREEVARESADVEQFRRLPNQVNGPRHRSVLRHNGDIFVPVSINDKPATYFFDTGAWVSVMSEAEAVRLGLPIREAPGVLSDASGRGVRSRFVVVTDLTLGSMRFHNVSFLVPPNQEPWVSLPAGRGGILGIPLLLGMGAIRWSKSGTVELAATGERTSPGTSNLVFYRNRLLVRTSVLGTRVFGTLDTGAESTDLNSNFATQFTEFVQRTGTNTTTDVTGVGGTRSLEAIRLPEVVFEIGGTAVALRPATLTRQRNPSMGGDCCVANIGLDLLTQTGAFAIDFSRMLVRVH